MGGTGRPMSLAICAASSSVIAMFGNVTAGSKSVASAPTLDDMGAFGYLLGGILAIPALVLSVLGALLWVIGTVMSCFCPEVACIIYTVNCAVFIVKIPVTIVHTVVEYVPC